jgi:hypothetical protein
MADAMCVVATAGYCNFMRALAVSFQGRMVDGVKAAAAVEAAGIANSGCDSTAVPSGPR